MGFKISVAVFTSLLSLYNSAAIGTELVLTPFGGRSASFGAGGVFPTNNDCSDCVMDGDVNTAWDVVGTSIGSSDGEMTLSATRFFPDPAVMDTLSVRLSVEADTPSGSTRTKQVDFQIFYRNFGGEFVELVNESLGPIGVRGLTSLSFNSTLTDLNLRATGLRLQAHTEFSDGTGASTLGIRFYHLGATGVFVPEPSALLLVGVASAAMLLTRRFGRLRG